MDNAVLKVNEKLIVPAPRYVFYIIGAGGTGSYLIRDLARIVSIMNETHKREDEIVIIDGDVVEPKNLNRQNFVARDINKNKAEVLASRYSKSFGVRIGFVNEYITLDNIKDIMTEAPKSRGSKKTTPIILGCVDNNKTRHIIDHFVRKATSDYVWIDSGNEEHGGQIVFSANSVINKNGNSHYMVDCGTRKSLINNVVTEFDLDNNDKHPSDLSCAERAESAPQNIATNILAANIIFEYCNTLLASACNYYNGINTVYNSNERADLIARAPMIMNHICYFNSKTMQVSTKPFSEEVQRKLRNKH